MKKEVKSKEKSSIEEKKEEDSNQQDENLFTVFDLEGEEYGVEIDMMNEIIRDLDISRIPGSSDDVLGAVNLRGEVIPVIDLKKILDIGSTGDEVKETMIIQINERRFAAPVDRLKDIVSSEKDQLVDPSDITNLDDKRLKWIMKLETGRTIRVLNIRNLVDNEIGKIETSIEKQ